MLKQDVLRTINDLPDEVSIADVMYRLYVLDGHHRALADIAAGRVHSTEDVRNNILKNP